MFLYLERKKGTPFALASGFLLEIKINFLHFDLKQDLETMGYKEKLGKNTLKNSAFDCGFYLLSGEGHW